MWRSSSLRLAGVSQTPSLQAQQALTVTQNKLGDLWYRLGNLESARGLYKEALNRRKTICESSSSDMTAQIDYALSLAKVADIEQVRIFPWISTPSNRCLEQGRLAGPRLGY